MPSRPLYTPGADFNQRKIPATRQPRRTWFRVHRFIDQPCLALFDRGGMAAQLQETLLGPLHSLDATVDWLDEHKAALV
jgi:hypothetical protein